MGCLCCVTAILSAELRVGMSTCCYTLTKVPHVKYMSVVLVHKTTHKPVKHKITKHNAHRPNVLNTPLFNSLILFSASAAHYQNIMRQTQRPGAHQALSAVMEDFIHYSITHYIWRFNSNLFMNPLWLLCKLLNPTFLLKVARLHCRIVCSQVQVKVQPN